PPTPSSDRLRLTMPNYPVIIGVGQFTNHAKALDKAIEPADLMAIAARAAATDSGRGDILASVDSLQVVNILSWPYEDAPGLLAQRLGITPSHTLYSAVGGDTPQRLINEVAEEVVSGTKRVALIAGCEVLASRTLARKNGLMLDWPRGTPRELVGDTRMGISEAEARHGAAAPTRMYPLFENALRVHLGQTIEEHQQYVGELCSRLTRVAATNPYAWFPRARTPDEITTVSPSNRWVCFPYPKLMNAIMQVDQAAAVIVTRSETAREMGIPEEKWVYVRGCGQANDKWFVSDRVNYHSSPGIKAATSRALSMAGLTVDEIDFFDLYSCFPSAVQFGLDALGLRTDEPRDITVTGGLPYFGGAGNNYVMHSVSATVERLRANPGQKALLTGLGWFATKHSAGVYSTTPPAGDWMRTDPDVDQAPVEAMPGPVTTDAPDGAATVETYTVGFGRDGEPEIGIVVGRLDTGERFFANTAVDADLLWSMTREEFIGTTGRVSTDAPTKLAVFTPD
ncbi:MAG: acetyl-CoA acetyltransferase, partial [Dehalococcoidia bacterium]